jgi:hypothetical protein
LSLPDINDLGRILESLIDTMTWADAEIDAAQSRHPATADRLWRSFVLLVPTHPRMHTEMLFRAHCRELLERVARGEDTRSGTSAECCIVLSAVTVRGPLNTTAAGLYARMWRKAGLLPAELSDASEHYEALEAPRIDEQKAWLRRKLRQPWRVLPPATLTASSQEQE